MILTVLITLIYVTITTILFSIIGSGTEYFGNTEVPIDIGLSTALLASCSILFGILAKMIHDDLLVESSKNHSLSSVITEIINSISPRRFFRALIIAPIILLLIYSQISNLSYFLVFLISFQNGFFFQTITQPS